MRTAVRAFVWWRWLLGLGVVLVLAAPSPAPAQTADPDVYSATVRRIQFFKSSTPASNALPDHARVADVEIDLRSFSAGAVAATYGTVPLSPGTYNVVRVTVSCTFKLKGSLTSGGTTFFTTATGTSVVGPATEGTFTAPSPPCAQDPYGVLGSVIVTDAQISFQVGGAAPPAAKITFNTTNTLQLYPGGQLGPSAPKVDLQIDGAKATFK